MPTDSQNFPASATSAGEALHPAAAGDGAHAGLVVVHHDDVLGQVVRAELLDLRRSRVVLDAHRAGAGPVEVLRQLLDDVLPEVVEHAADAHPRVLAGAADERVDAEAQRADSGLGGQFGHRLELTLGVRVVELVVGLGGGVEALGQPADDVDRRGELFHRPAVRVVGGDVIDAVEVEAMVVVGREVRGTEARHDRPHGVVGEVMIGAGPAVRRERLRAREEVDASDVVLGRAEERLPLLAVLLPRRRPQRVAGAVVEGECDRDDAWPGHGDTLQVHLGVAAGSG